MHNKEEVTFENNENDETKIDLSYVNLETFPLASYKTFKNVQHVHLEGNKIKRIDDEFFTVFEQLRWFDIRNNELLQIPKTIANHQCLQVLLLEGNRLTSLPVELGAVPNLRGLQLARNPLTFPPQNVVDEGSAAVIKFLQDEWKHFCLRPKQDIIRTTALINDSEDSRNENRKVKFQEAVDKINFQIKSNSKSIKLLKPQQSNLKDCFKVTKLSGQPKSKPVMNTFTASDKDCEEELTQGESDKSEDEQKPKYVKNPNEKNRSEKKTAKARLKNDGLLVKSKLIKDAWLKRIRDVLEEQETELQRNRDKDVLKKWQVDAKEQQIKKWAEYVQGSFQIVDAPFGTHDEYQKMPSRKDLKDKRMKHKWKKPDRKVSFNGEILTSKINSVVDMLKEIRNSRNNRTFSLRTEQSMLADEIKQINSLQQALSSLKTENDNHL